MGDHRAIADAGESLVELLQGTVGVDNPSDTIVLGTPGTRAGGGSGPQGSTAPRLSVFLYRVVPSAALRNSPRDVAETAGPGDATTVTPAPLAVELHYLVTAHATGGTSASGTTAETADQHRVLGWAMQALAAHPVLDGSDLLGSLAGDPPVEVTLERSRLDDIVDVWSTFPDRPFEPSASYVLSPVLVEATESADGQRVTDRTIDTEPIEPGAHLDGPPES